MECNKEDAIRAKEIAENKMQKDDFQGALKFAQKAKHLFPELENISQMLAVCDVHIAAQNKICSSEFDWYKILQLEKLVDEATIKKQYKKLALALHPDRNKFPGAEAAFKLIHEANMVLSDKENRSLYDSKCRSFPKESSVPKPGGDKKYYTEVENKNHNVFCSDQVNQSPFSGKYYYHLQNHPQTVIPSLYSSFDDLQKSLEDLHSGFECRTPNVSSSSQFNDLNHLANHQQTIQPELYGNVFTRQFNDLNHLANHQQAQHRDLFGRVESESTPNVYASQSNHHYQAEQQPHSYTGGAQNKTANVSSPLSSNLHHHHHHQPAEQPCLNSGVGDKKSNVSTSQFGELNHHQSAQSDGGQKFSACFPFGHMMHHLLHRKKERFT